MNFDYELITDDGKHICARNALNEDSLCVNNFFLTVASCLLRQSKPSHLNYELIHGSMDNSKVRTKT